MKQPSNNELHNIKRRETISNKELGQQFIFDRLDKQWLLLTEVIRRNILTNSKTRKAVQRYITEPIGESLPNFFLNDLSFNIKILKLKEKYKNEIWKYLELESIPEEKIVSDIKYAESITKPEENIKLLKGLYGSDTPEYYRYLKKYIDSGIFLVGITAEEKLIIAQRYRFARDIKLLALQAEVLDNQNIIKNNNSKEVILPSGTIINIHLKNHRKNQELLNPQNWKKRRQIKDRVYEIKVGSSKYILKEKKTARHIDTFDKGHESGLTSKEEFETAKYFQENCIVEQGNIKVNWEKPVSSVTFPDGFQFTIFEYEDSLFKKKYTTEDLSKSILKHRKQFEDEYIVIKKMAKKFKDYSKVLLFENKYENTESGLKTILEWIDLKKKKKLELSFEDFAEVKAIRMERQAEFAIRENIVKNGYINKDTDEYSYKINLKNGKLQLEIFGYDFEYFFKISQYKSLRMIDRYRKEEKKRENNGIGFSTWYHNNRAVTRMQRACYFAMLKADGLFEEKKGINKDNIYIIV